MSALIIGGGIGGLATAYALQTRGYQGTITLCESGQRWGGVIETTRGDGFLLEHGPDAVLTTKPAATALADALGLGGDLIGTEPTARRACIVRGKRLIPIPDGLYLLAPGKLWPFACSPIISWAGKLRMAMDLLIPARQEVGDESLGSFVRRRLGREALTRLAQPLVGAIHSGDPDQLSLLATMPQFAAMEREHGGVIRALRQRQNAAPAGTSGPRYGLFATVRDGLSGLVAALVESLSGCCLELGRSASRASLRDGVWTVRFADGVTRQADHLILALPAHAAARLVGDLDPNLSGELAAIPYHGVTTVNLAVRESEAPRLPICAGFVVPAVEGRSIIAVSCASRKFAGRAPDGKLLLRAAVSGPIADQHSDAALIDTVCGDLRELVGLASPPLFATVRRWSAVLPDYRVGHLARVARIRALETSWPGLGLVGNGYEGTGIPDVIANADRVAERVTSQAASAARPGPTAVLSAT